MPDLLYFLNHRLIYAKNYLKQLIPVLLYLENQVNAKILGQNTLNHWHGYTECAPDFSAPPFVSNDE